MKVYKLETAETLGAAAARFMARKINEAIEKKGEARIVLSTGASQFETLSALVKEDVDWSKVTAFHLDEYINLPIDHPASFRKYLKERFVDQIPLKEMVFVNTESEAADAIAEVTQRLLEKPIDLGAIGIGENAHIAFNDPPADFDTKESYIVVNLNDKCKRQQVREGWFAAEIDVPDQAVSMTAYQIMQCECIVSAVPHSVKAEAIVKTLSAAEVTNEIPATLLKTHKEFHLFIDEYSASACSKGLLEKYK